MEFISIKKKDILLNHFETKYDELYQEFSKHYNDKASKAFVLMAKSVSNGDIIGCIAGCKDVDYDDDFKAVHIPIFVVVEEYRRKKYGTRIMAEFQESAIEKGYTHATLDVDQENEAQNLYSRLGFKDMVEKRMTGNHREMVKAF